MTSVKPEPQNWALAFAPVKSFLWQWSANSRPILHIFSAQVEEKIGKTSKTRILLPSEVLVNEEPLFELFSPGDSLYTEMGGRNATFCLQALARDVEVFRIPTFRITALLPKDNKMEDRGDIGKANEKKAELNRRGRAKMLMELAQTSPEQFYPMLAPDAPILRVKTIIQNYLSLQKNFRIPAQLRRYAMQLDFSWLPDTAGPKDLLAIRELLAKASDVEYYLELEAKMLAAAQKELAKIAIQNQFFATIKGIGPSLAGRLVAGIEDIRRFPKRDGLRAYAAWSVTDEGKAPKFRRQTNGENIGPKYSPDIKQALFLVGEQIVRQGKKNPYNALYEAKKVYYSQRDPDKPAIIHHRRAVRAAVSKFVNDLWAAWWRIFEDLGEPLPESVQVVLHPRTPVIED